MERSKVYCYIIIYILMSFLSIQNINYFSIAFLPINAAVSICIYELIFLKFFRWNLLIIIFFALINFYLTPQLILSSLLLFFIIYYCEKS